MSVTTYATIAALRANTTAYTVAQPPIYVSGYTTANDGGEGFFQFAVGDKSTADDSGMNIVDAAGNRWQRPRGSPVSVKWFGAAGNATTDDTTAFQNWLNYLKSNQPYIGTGNKTAGDGYMPAGTYLITKSLDCTSTGTGITGFTINGADKLNTVLVDALTEPYPVWDMTSMYNMLLRNFQIRSTTTTQSTCLILMAQDRNDTFITYYNRLEHLGLTQVYTSANAVAALVVQNNDLLVVNDVQCEGYRAASVGWRLPVLRQNRCSGAGGSNTIVLDSGASSTNNAYVGYPIRLVSGTGASGGNYSPLSNPVIGQITAYNGTTKTATVDITWPVADPNATTIYEIYAIKSKFKVPQSHIDITHIRFVNNCALTASQPLLHTGIPGALDLGDTYLAGEHTLTTDACGILFAPMYSSDLTIGPTMVLGEMIAFENQSSVSAFDLIKNNTGGVPVVINMRGTFEGAYATGSAIFRDDGVSGFASIDITGAGATPYQMFNLGGSLQDLRGTLYTSRPGVIAGGVGSWTFDWYNRSADPLWLPFIYANCRSVAQTGAGTAIPTAQVQTPVQGATGYIATTGYTWWVYPSPNNAYTGGSGNQPCVGFTIPANMLAANAATSVQRKIRLRCGMTVSARTTAFGVYLTNGSNSTQLVAGPALSPGNMITFELILEAGAGTTFTASGYCIVAGTIYQMEYQPSSFSGFSAANATTLSFNVTSVSNNPLSTPTVIYCDAG